MAKFNIESTRTALQDFDFKKLFIEELGWHNPPSAKVISEVVKAVSINRKPIAQLAGAAIFEIATPEGTIPDSTSRTAIAKHIQQLHFHNVVIFIDNDRTKSIWHWLKQQDKKFVRREHFYTKGQPGDLFISKLSSLVFDISEFDAEGNVPIVEVAERVKQALNVEQVTKQFFKQYQEEYLAFIELIQGITDDKDRRWYASILLNRLMFIYFLQKKSFVANGNQKYLHEKLDLSKKEFGTNQYYEKFLKVLFFEGFAKPADKRGTDAKSNKEINNLLGDIVYLNGGLFLRHKTEIKYPAIKIPDVAFQNLFALFERFSWNLNDTPGGKDDEINPDVLGYIFEKYINQKAFGAYYTRPQITEYLCEQTIYKLILDQINDPEGTALLQKAAKSELKIYHFDSISELLINLDAELCKKLLFRVLPSLSLLDPACGSGAFLVAAMKTLINIYSAVIGKIKFLSDKKLTEWLHKTESAHPSISYFIKREIITNNLYGVDIMEEATEIAKLRLFLALVASAQTVVQLEPLPNIDFNILQGNSLMGLLRVEPKMFKQMNLLGEKDYEELVKEKSDLIREYKNLSAFNPDMKDKRDEIDSHRRDANQTLNIILGGEFQKLGIKHEQVTWDEKKNTEGKSIKRPIARKDIEALIPFHWAYEFSEIFEKNNGFDAIITNPPWEVFKPNSKEFFLDYSKVVSKKKMNIKDFEMEQEKILEDDEIREAWTDYLSRFPHVSEYYRNAKQYENQISIVNGKKAGSDINLYKLFTEQCFNLLKKNGYCGIVIPSGIYTDLGTKQLRQMLFEQNKVTGLFCFENRKEIFEGVHRSFKFVVLSFEKGGKTKSFPAAYMRLDVQELENFPKYGAFDISIEFIKKQSPDSLSIMEIKNEVEFNIADKMLKFPLLGEILEDSWNIKLSREIDPSAVKDFVRKEFHKGFEPIISGEMIGQFSFEQNNPKYWIKKEDARKIILGKTFDTNQKLDYQDFRFGFRKIARNTDSRTLISTIIPPRIVQESLQFISRFDNVNRSPTNTELCVILAFFNSFVLDYQIRQSVSSNINFFFINNLPVPRLKPKDKWYKPIVERAAKLICTTGEFSALWEEVMKTKWTEKQAATQEYEPSQLRAELDGIITHIYGLTEEEFQYILTTFPIVAQSQKDAALECFKAVRDGKLKE